MEDLMRFDPQKRPGASQTLQYPFFQVNASLPPPAAGARRGASRHAQPPQSRRAPRGSRVLERRQVAAPSGRRRPSRSPGSPHILRGGRRWRRRRRRSPPSVPVRRAFARGRTPGGGPGGPRRLAGQEGVLFPPLRRPPKRASFERAVAPRQKRPSAPRPDNVGVAPKSNCRRDSARGLTWSRAAWCRQLPRRRRHRPQTGGEEGATSDPSAEEGARRRLDGREGAPLLRPSGTASRRRKAPSSPVGRIVAPRAQRALRPRPEFRGERQEEVAGQRQEGEAAVGPRA